MLPALLMLDDGQVTAHLSRALAEHLRWCARNGITPPPELAVILAALEASRDPERPLLVTSSVPAEPDLVDYGTAAARLSVSARTVRRMVADGRLDVMRIGRRRLIRAADLVALTREGVRGDGSRARRHGVADVGVASADGGDTRRA